MNQYEVSIDIQLTNGKTSYGNFTVEADDIYQAAFLAWQECTKISDANPDVKGVKPVCIEVV